MELLVPALAVGGMYLASQQERNESARRVESKANVKDVTTGPLPNYPIDSPATEANNLNYYSTPNAVTDKYFQQEAAVDRLQGLTGEYMLLSGEKKAANEFTHNNMQPFFGSTVKQPRTMPRGNESGLDAMTGAGSQYVKKTERAPLFSPKPDAHWANGTPSTSDFVQSRQVAPMSRNNDKPWESVQVGPGLGEGFASAGSGGYNAGLEARQLWAPKTVDELRAASNPKCSYEGVTLGGQHFAPKRGVMGSFQKNNPDTHYEMGADRYLTTGGAEAKPSGRPTQELPPQARTETTKQTWGVGGNATGGVGEVRGTYELPRRQALDGDISHPGAAVSAGGGAPGASTGNHGRDGYQSYTTSRALTGGRTSGLLGGAVAAVKALFVPFQEQLRPTRKENVIGNARPLGGASSDVAAGPAHSNLAGMRVTKKQMHVVNDFPNAPAQYGVHQPMVQNQQAVFTNRGETSRSFTPGGGATGASSLPRDHTAVYAGARGADKESTLVGRTNQGASSLFNGNYAPARSVNTIDHAHHMIGFGATVKEPPSKQTVGSQSHHAPLHGGAMERLGDGAQLQHASNPYSHSVLGN